MQMRDEGCTFDTSATKQQGANVTLNGTDTDQLIPDKVGIVRR